MYPQRPYDINACHGIIGRVSRGPLSEPRARRKLEILIACRLCELGDRLVYWQEGMVLCASVVVFKNMRVHPS